MSEEINKEELSEKMEQESDEECCCGDCSCCSHFAEESGQEETVEN